MEISSTILLFGLAFVVLPFGSSWYEIPKAFVMLLSMAMSTVIFFWEGTTWKNSYFLFIGFFILSVLGLVTSWTPTIFFGNPFRMQGILTLWALLSWAIISSQTKIHMKNKIIAFVSLVVMLGIAVVGQTDASGRAVGAVGEANSLGAYALFLLPIAQTVWAAIPAIILVLLSGSRSALVGLIAEATILLGSKRFSLPIVTMLATIILIASLFFPFLDAKQDFDYRVDIWRTALHAGMKKPIFGWGIGNTEVGLKAAAEDTQTFLRYQYVDSSHNVFLDWWVQGGTIGVLLFSVTVLLTIKNLIRHTQIYLLASFLGILSVMLFNPVSISILVPFWWIVGKGMSIHTERFYRSSALRRKRVSTDVRTLE